LPESLYEKLLLVDAKQVRRQLDAPSKPLTRLQPDDDLPF
jgi:hypothetical protein